MINEYTGFNQPPKDCPRRSLEEVRIDVLEKQVEQLQIDLDDLYKSYQDVAGKLNDALEESEKVLDLISSFGYIDGVHHKQWLLDQIVRVLLGKAYASWLLDGWDKGVAP